MADTEDNNLLEEIKRIRRVSDQMCTMHANLRDMYSRRALVLEIAILSGSLIVVAQVFADPIIAERMDFLSLENRIWLGVFSIVVLISAIIQLIVNWKGQKEAHERAHVFYSVIKLECGRIIAGDELESQDNLRNVINKYNNATNLQIGIPESYFLPLKRRHKIKILISRYLDEHPGVSLIFLKLRLWWRDNRAKLPSTQNKN